jgi:hypothetical protein
MSKDKKERFKKPTDRDYVEIAVLFNEGKLNDKVVDMIAMAEFIVDRLYDNGNVEHKSLREIEIEKH